MLKFIRKYQLILLAIGGSLLMVVFLFEPIINRIGAASTNKTVARMHGGTRKITMGERYRAAAERQVMSDIVPILFGDTRRGAVGMINLDDEFDHWLLLKIEAEEAGFIGEADEGRMWLTQELAQIMAFTEKQAELYRQLPYMPFVNQRMNDPQVQAQIAQRADELGTVIPARVRQQAAKSGIQENDVYEMFAHARGVSRLIRRHDQAARQSDSSVVRTVRTVFDSAIADYAVVPAGVLTDESLMPTDEQLAAHFERFRDFAPGEGDLGIGYKLPSRVKLGWITLYKTDVAAAIVPDRIEIRKRWSENRLKYPGEFDSERTRVEQDFINEQASELMLDIDRIVSGQMRNALRDTTRTGNYWNIPETWGGVTMESLSESIVTQLAEQRKITIPHPAITYRVDRWFTSSQIAALAGFGKAWWQVGPQRVPVSEITNLAKNLGGSRLIAIQERIPVVEPPATDDAGNRYYVVLFGSREMSPPDSWEEIREQLVADYRRLSAFEALVDQLPGLEQLAMDEGLEGVINWFPVPEGDEATEQPRPKLTRWVQISRNGQQPLDQVYQPDYSLNKKEFLDAVLTKAEALDPLAEFDSYDPSTSVLSVALPSEQSVVIAKVLAFRPATQENRYALRDADVRTLASREIAEAMGEDRNWPFTLDAMIKRHDYVLLDRGRDDDE